MKSQKKLGIILKTMFLIAACCIFLNPTSGITGETEEFVKYLWRMTNKCGSEYNKDKKYCDDKYGLSGWGSMEANAKENAEKCYKKALDDYDNCLDEKKQQKKAKKLGKKVSKLLVKKESAEDKCNKKGGKCLDKCTKLKDGSKVKGCVDDCNENVKDCVDKVGGKYTGQIEALKSEIEATKK